MVDTDEPHALFVDNWQTETSLTRASKPVLDSLEKEIENEPVCLILTDAKGTVLDRRGGDATLLRHLDTVNLAQGFTYSEQHVGTNGIGTALEVGGPVLVNGAEHYTGALTSFSCAGALITHPVNGTLLGVIDLTTSARHTNSLLLSFAKMAARRIRDRILENAGALERALLEDYYAACHHSGKAVLAVGDDVLMLNAQVHQRFDASDQAAIIEQAHEVRGSTATHSILAELPSGLTARLAYQPSFSGEELAGGVMVVREQAVRAAIGTGSGPTLRGVVGESALWQRVSTTVLQACSAGRWVALRGEQGSGRARLLQAAHDQARPRTSLHTHDATTPTEPAALLEQLTQALEDGSDLVLLEATLLAPETLDGIADLLQDRVDGGDAPWVAMTVGDDEEGDSLPLVRLFGSIVNVPPLRQHIEDLPGLARHLLDRLRAPDLRLSSAALNQLGRLPWQGNVDELQSMLQSVTRNRHAGTVEVDDLPAACRTMTRRRLSPIEALERDAIVEALSLHGQDKSAAAASLGISRATIYRRIRDFGIVL